MRVLLVNAFPAASGSGRTRFDEFRHHVRCVMAEIERGDVTQVDIIEKSRQDLDAYLFEMHSEFADPQSITNFDRLDFVLVAGDVSACPWAPQLRKLVLLTKMCMMTGKCFYGSGLGASLLAFLCATAGESLRVINNAGKGNIVTDLQSVPPPLMEDAMATRPRHSAAAVTDVLLDTRTGDYFSFERGTHAWVPRGNTGLMHHSSDHAHDYGVRLNTARAGTKKTHRSELSHALLATKRGDTKCCVRLDATSHEIFRTGIAREFLANCNSSWDLDERISATGKNQYRVLVDSKRGPLLIEFGNCVGSHFTLSREYTESWALLRNFVAAKVEFLKVHEHIDRSFVSAISGSARLKQRLQLAATKTATAVAVAALGSTRGGSSHPPHGHMGLATGAVTMASGRTSPKRCRPVSAGPYRSPAKSVASGRRTIQTSRSEYPSTMSRGGSNSPQHRKGSTTAGLGSLPWSNQWEVRDEQGTSRPTRPHTARASTRLPGKSPRDLGPETESPLHSDDSGRHEAFVSPRVSLHNANAPIKAHRRIRVAQRDELDKPYCAINKFTALEKAEKVQRNDPYYSVVNDAPYRSKLECEMLAHQQEKLKWVSGPFRSTVGKASSQPPVSDVGIFTRVPFDERNAPSVVIQRRQLEPPSPPPRPKVFGRDPSKRTRPASAAAASTRRPQR